MTTPKQVRKVMKKIYYHQDKLQDALTEAHNLGVIAYAEKEENSYFNYAPCSTAYELRKRINITTQKTMADALKSEILNGR